MSATELSAVLENLERHLESGERRRAYEQALELWSRTHAPEVAVWIGALTRALRADRGAPSPGSIVDFKRDWVPHCRALEPYESERAVEALLEVWKGLPGFFDAAFDELSPLPLDPAVALAATRLMLQVTPRESTNKPMKKWVRWLGSVGDPRTVPALQTIARSFRQAQILFGVDELCGKIVNQLSQPGVPLDPEITRKLVESSERLATTPLLPCVDRRRAPAPDGDVRSTYEAMLASPDSLDARAVWVDALLAEGDPLGERLAVALAADRDPKLAASFHRRTKKEWKIWLGAIAPSIHKDGLEFDRGLLSSCVVTARSQTAADVLFEAATSRSSPPTFSHWATVRRITFAKFGRLTEAFRWLEEVYGANEAALHGIDRIELPRLRFMEVKLIRPTPQKLSKGLTALSRAPRLPALRALRLHHGPLAQSPPHFARPGEFDWVFAAPWESQLSALDLPLRWSTADAKDLSRWLARALRPGRAIQLRDDAIRRGYSDTRATLSLDSDRRTATIEHAPHFGGTDGELVAAARAAVAALDFHVTTAPPPEVADETTT
jgi:hypothetical protein